MDMFLLAEPSTQTNREAQRVTDEAGSDPSSRERLRAGSFLRFFFHSTVLASRVYSFGYLSMDSGS
jgi:hypothetical protein